MKPRFGSTAGENLSVGLNEQDPLAGELADLRFRVDHLLTVAVTRQTLIRYQNTEPALSKTTDMTDSNGN